MNKLTDLMQPKWGLPADVRQKLMGRMVEIATDGRPTDAVNAFSRIIDAQKVDLQAMQVALTAAAISQLAPPEGDDVVISVEDMRDGEVGLVEHLEGPKVVESEVG